MIIKKHDAHVSPIIEAGDTKVDAVYERVDSNSVFNGCVYMRVVTQGGAMLVNLSTSGAHPVDQLHSLGIMFREVRAELNVRPK